MAVECRDGSIVHTLMPQVVSQQAQKRFRSRQKEHLAESERTVQELTARMAELSAEKQRVDLRNQVLGHLLHLTHTQVSETQAMQVSYQLIWRPASSSSRLLAVAALSGI